MMCLHAVILVTLVRSRLSLRLTQTPARTTVPGTDGATETHQFTGTDTQNDGLSSNERSKVPLHYQYTSQTHTHTHICKSMGKQMQIRRVGSLQNADLIDFVGFVICGRPHSSSSIYLSH